MTTKWLTYGSTWRWSGFLSSYVFADPSAQESSERGVSHGLEALMRGGSTPTPTVVSAWRPNDVHSRNSQRMIVPIPIQHE
ncbi:hypothetical protein R1flu_001033 [Riccia fluitans]|uniref:Uncharacterized protein n=1 Tax=Riccia fluitans TaxID=41844 RepID=A0ABD1Y267_9MARC